MKHKNPSDPKHQNYNIDDTFEKNVCSAMEMTGLIPALPEDAAELHHYEELYLYLPAPAELDEEDEFL